jgi:hypothetical protein
MTIKGAHHQLWQTSVLIVLMHPSAIRCSDENLFPYVML